MGISLWLPFFIVRILSNFEENNLFLSWNFIRFCCLSFCLLLFKKRRNAVEALTFSLDRLFYLYSTSFPFGQSQNWITVCIILSMQLLLLICSCSRSLFIDHLMRLSFVFAMPISKLNFKFDFKFNRRYIVLQFTDIFLDSVTE